MTKKKKSAPKKKVAKKGTTKKVAKKSEVIVGYKTVDTEMKAFHDGKFKYAVGKNHTVKVPAHSMNGAPCGKGLHFAPTKQGAINFARGYDEDYILLEVQSLKSDIIGKDSNKYRTKKLFVSKIIATVNSIGPEWKQALSEIKALNSKICVPNKNVTSKQITAAVEAIRKVTGRKKLNAYITNNLYEANAAVVDIPYYAPNSGCGKSFSAADSAANESDVYKSHDLPIDTYAWKEILSNLFHTYLEAHELPSGTKIDEKKVAKIKPYFDLLSLGCFPIGFGSKQNFVIFKPDQKLSDMKCAF